VCCRNEKLMMTAQESIGWSVAGWSEGALLACVPSDVTVCTRPTRATTKIPETSVIVPVPEMLYCTVLYEYIAVRFSTCSTTSFLTSNKRASRTVPSYYYAYGRRDGWFARAGHSLTNSTCFLTSPDLSQLRTLAVKLPASRHQRKK
jgi:hypothetical protein